MSDTGRSRRAGPGPSRASNALQQLRELKRTGKKQGIAYELKEEEAVYDVVDEDDYADIVAKRRREGGDFVEDDDGMGYVDMGEEDDWGREGDEEDENVKDVNPKKRKDEAGLSKGNAKKKAVEPSRAEQQRAAKMFSLASSGRGPASRHNAMDTAAADALLEELLNSDVSTPVPRAPFNRGPGTAVTRPIGRGVPTGQGISRLAQASYMPPTRALHRSYAMPRATQDVAVRPLLQHNDPENQDYDDSYCDGPVDMDDDPPSGAAMEEDNMAIEDVDPVAQPQKEAGGSGGDFSTPGARGRHGAAAGENESKLLDITPGPAHVGEPKMGAATPWRTPAAGAAAMKTPTSAVAVSGWQEIYADGAGEEEAEAAEEDAVPWEDDGSLPLDTEGSLPFYFIDAHEEASTPGTVYMFGKVPQGKGFLSCCAIVRNCMRNVFFVPRSDIFTCPELDQLEEEAAADPTTKKALIRFLHELASDLKAEVRELLAAKGITKFVIKPVKRRYAFEVAEVRHCEQWVLKVRYDASLPTLDMGLTGSYFTAVFGTQQSILESLLLKRRIKGASWLSINRPTRVDSSKQLSWSKLEVDVPSPKAIGQEKFAEGTQKPRDPPPLVVAALNIKTVLDPKTSANEIVAASVVYVSALPVHRPCPKAEWNKPPQMRHFSVVRKIGRKDPFPAGFDNLVREANESRLGRISGGEQGRMLAQQSTEAGLLNYLLGRLEKLDADVYCGHNIAAFDMDVLLHRLQHNKVANWSRLGRLKRSKVPNLGGGGHIFGGGASAGLLSVLAGRLLCDTYLAARELVKSIDYTLTTLSQSLLGQSRHELCAAEVPGKYASGRQLMELIQHTEGDAWLALGLATHLNVLPLSRELSCISGYLWSRTLQGQRAARIEMLLLHEFYSRKYLLPDKLTARERTKQADRKAAAMMPDDDMGDDVKGDGKAKGPQYAGGLVLEPKRGLYDKFVLLLDFNSLYPSIIQEYNICFTTVDCPKDGGIAPLPPPSDHMAVLPTVIARLVDQRRAVKRQKAGERNPLLAMQLDVRQQALKLTANSMYGCLGFSSSRFYAKPLAELVTSQGREVLQSTVDTVQGSIGADVIYGDTDSIMVATGSNDLMEVQKLGQRIKEAINKRYRKLELEIDGIFKVMLLLKKKKYAAITIDPVTRAEVREIKGLDMVRRDWCGLAKEVGSFALGKILSGQPCEEVVEAIHQHLREVRRSLDEGAVPLDRFIITKQLTKRPEDYPAKEAQIQPHVVVALRRKAAHMRGAVMQGETVPYIICVEKPEPVADGAPAIEPPPKALADRAYHPDELAANPRLAPDLDYYLAQQVHPLVARLCGPIEGTDPARLADCLGLDSAKFHSATHAVEESREDPFAGTVTLDDETRFQNCESLWLREGDGSRFRFAGVSDIIKGTVAADTALVPPDRVGSGEGLSAARLSNQVRLRAREAIVKYYDGWMRSDDDDVVRTRDICLRHQEGVPAGCTAPPGLSTGTMSREVTEAMLYSQLAYFSFLLDGHKALLRLKGEDAQMASREKLVPIQGALQSAFAQVRGLQDRNGYSFVNLAALLAAPAG